MRDRPRDGIHVVLSESHEFEQGVGRGHDADVRMAGALGVGGGARRVVDPTVTIDRWRRASRRALRVCGRQAEVLLESTRVQALQVDLHHLEVMGSGKPPRHRPMGKTSPLLRHDEQLGTDLLGDERHFPLTQNWDQWVLDGANPRQRDEEHHGFNRRWQLPGDHRVGFDAAVRERSGSSFCGVAELDSCQRPVVIVGHHGRVRFFIGCLNDEIPERRRQRRPHHAVSSLPRPTTS